MTRKRINGPNMFVIVPANTGYERIGRIAERNIDKRWDADWIVDVISEGRGIESKISLKEKDLVPMFPIPVESWGLSLKDVIEKYNHEIIADILEFFDTIQEVSQILAKKQRN